MENVFYTIYDDNNQFQKIIYMILKVNSACLIGFRNKISFIKNKSNMKKLNSVGIVVNWVFLDLKINIVNILLWE